MNSSFKSSVMVMKAPLLPILFGRGRGKGFFLYKVTHHRVTRSELEFQVISHGDESSLIAHTIWSGEGKGLFSLQSNSPQRHTS